MPGRIHLLSLLVFFIASACAEKPILNVEDLNTATWKEDEQGCKGLRLLQLDAFKRCKHKLEGVDENRIIKLLGKPDEFRLHNRGQKIYTYFTEAGKKCGDAGNLKPTRQAVQVRFNAIYKVNEITILLKANH